MVNTFSTPVLQRPVAITKDYMLLPIEVSFSWQACFQDVERGEWYLVVFRSKHRPDADEALLTELDNAASAAARETPGFLHYFIGIPRVTGECLSFCLWENATSARVGSSHPAHDRAMKLGVPFYEYYTLERYVIQKTPEQLSFRRLS